MMEKNICELLGLEKVFEDNYLIKDIYGSEELNDIKIMFLLESPHNEEVKCKHPLAGKSGVNMTKFFCKVFNFTEPRCCNKIAPFGKLVQDAHDKNIDDKIFVELYKNSKLRAKLRKIGIMNVCNIPMQMQVYCCDDIRKYCEILRVLYFLRDHPKADENKNSRDKIKKHFGRRMDALSNIKLFIPMGKFAQSYFITYLKNKLNNGIESNIVLSKKKTTLINSIYKYKENITDGIISKYLKKSMQSENLSQMINKINTILQHSNSFEISHPSPLNKEWNKIERTDFENLDEKLKEMGNKIKDILLRNNEQ